MNNIFIRKVNESDSKEVFQHSNKDFVREYSINKDNINWDDHVTWFENTIVDANCFFYIVTDDKNNFLGQIRFIIEADTAVVSISLSELIRGKGYSCALLCNSMNKLFSERNDLKRVVAYISEENIPSLKLFSQAGFIYYSKKKEFLKYIYNRKVRDKMNTIKIGKYTIGDNNPCFIIAEAGSNHNGSLEQAKELINIAVEAGADAVKFQTFTGDKLFSKKHPANEVVKKFEFKFEWHKELKEYCDKKGIMFMTTPFQYEAVDLLEELKIDGYKIASGDMDYYPLLDYISNTGKPILLATGMASMDEVKESLNVIKSGKTKEVAVLHCVANYPPKDEDINLNVIKSLKNELDIPVGFSDHSMGISVPVAAVAMGANIIEKHFTISRQLEGMDHFYALEPHELKDMVSQIRRIEKAMGSGCKTPVKAEIPERHFARRGIIAAYDLQEGQIIEEKHLDYVRPVYGIESKYYKEIIGRKLKNAIKSDEPIHWEDLA